jgi:hypothetical protein
MYAGNETGPSSAAQRRSAENPHYGCTNSSNVSRSSLDQDITVNGWLCSHDQNVKEGKDR